MSWTDKLGGLLQQYTSGGAAAQPAPDVHDHFQQVSQAAPATVIAEGLAAAFKSDQTPAFGSMLSSLFAQSNGEQKAGVLNQLMGSVNPAMLTQILSSAGLAGVGSAGALTPQQAQSIPPEVVQQLATHAEKTNPSVIDSVSSFYAQHSTVIKALGGTAVSIALAKIAEKQR